MEEEKKIPEGESSMGNGKSAINNEQTPNNETKSEIENQKSTIEMEPHIHPHIHHEKKWKDYLFEFLMLFLAVSGGFFAENIREHSVENKRAKVFAESMLEDLKADTVELNYESHYLNYASGNVDTLLQLLSSANPQNISSGKLYWYGLWGGASFDFVPNDATFQQMKSSGVLRYFTNKKLSDEVSKYDQLCRNIQLEMNEDREIYVEVRKLRAQIFEFRYNNAANDIYQANRISFDQHRIDSFINSNPPLLTYDKIIFNQYAELVRSRFFNRKTKFINSLLQHAVDLINELEKNYS